MKKLFAALCLLLASFASFASFAAVAQTQESEVDFRKRINAFVDQWHVDAARADPVYFDKMAPDGVYIGTDKSEIWKREEFRAWAKPHFDRKKAWAFTAVKRNVYFSPDRRYAWFDEQLNTQMGLCQASGVIHATASGFEIAHYQLSLAVPNPLMDQFTKTIGEFERKAAPAAK